MKKKLLILLVFVLCLCCACNKEPQDDDPNAPKGALARQIAILNNDISSDIAILGDDSLVDPSLKRRVITEINENTLPDSLEYGYQALVIIDLDDSVVLEEKDFEFLENYIINQNNDVLYLGLQYLNRFCDMFHLEHWGDNGDNRGIGMYGCFPDDKSETGVGICEGVWTTENIEWMKSRPQELSEAIVSELSFNATGESYDY